MSAAVSVCIDDCDNFIHCCPVSVITVVVGMEGELVLPMLHAQYSSLPHQDTYRVEDNLGVVWDDVVQCVCYQHDMKFNSRFLKNPHHVSYKFISQLAYLMEELLPRAALLQATATSSADIVPAGDVEMFQQFWTGFTKSAEAAKDNTINESIETDDVQNITELCSAVNVTLNMPPFRKFESLKQVLGSVLKTIVHFISTAPITKTPPESDLTTTHIRPINHSKINNMLQKNRQMGLLDDERISNRTDEEVVVLCLPCGQGATAFSSASSSEKKPSSSSGSKRMMMMSPQDEDAFSRPNKHVYNGYCPCCD